MHPNPRRVLPVIVLLALAGIGYWYFFGGGRPTAANGALSASGTIEAVQVNVNPELGGRVVAVNAAEGEAVTAGAVLVQLDTTLLEAQRAQAAAAAAAAGNVYAASQSALAAAQAAAEAAQANAALLKAGPSTEQLAVAQTVIDKSQIAVDALQTSYDDLSEAAKDTANGKSLKQQLDTAIATLANAQAQYDLVKAGARAEQVAAAEAQARAAQAQAEAAQAQVNATQGQVDVAQAAVAVLDAQIAKLTIKAPADGVVLARAIEPGEVAAPGSTLLVIGELGELTITVYVPEDRYGNVRLGEAAQVTVDSFAGEQFTATVAHIADQFEFTPRNVQTAEGRKTTVFAVKLTIANPEGKLKPGMPADVKFGK